MAKRSKKYPSLPSHKFCSRPTNQKDMAKPVVLGFLHKWKLLEN